MNLPQLKDPGYRTQKNIVQFRGVNYSEAVVEGQLEESRNLSSNRFPCLSQRQGRERGETYENATAVWCKDGLMVVDGTSLIYNGAVIGTVSPGKKHFANVNTKIIIYPDKIMYDTSSGELRSLGAEYTAAANSVEFVDEKSLLVHIGSYCAEITSHGITDEILYKTSSDVSDQGYSYKKTVFDYRISSVSVNEDGTMTVENKTSPVYAEDWAVGDLFLDNSIYIDGVTSYGKITKINVRVERYGMSGGPTLPVTYKIDYYITFEYDRYEVRGTSYGSFSGYEAMNFRVGDTVEITGCTTCPENNKTLTIRDFISKDVSGETLYGLVFDAESFSQTGTEEGAVTIKRNVPNLTVFCEKDNRVYGAEGNTIYVSALGDPTNFFTFDGVDTDSYSVAVATEGDFTGCIGYGNSVLFFKENCLHKLMGDYPSQYTLYDYTVPGVLKGSELSLWNINEVVYYHGREGVYRYAGGVPELITENFGLRRFDTAAAGAQGERYYISMRDKQSDAWGMWVYDIQRGIWLQEDDTQAVCFAQDGGKLYYIDSGDGSLVLVNPESSEEAIEWSATLCRMDEVYLNRKCYSRLLLRSELDAGAWLKVEISCDDEPFRQVSLIHKESANTVVLPIFPNRCDSFRIRLSGGGRSLIRTLVREYDVGSEY